VTGIVFHIFLGLHFSEDFKKLFTISKNGEKINVDKESRRNE
jgi:hypothetical protein